jgi:hypothetical protein
MSEKDLPKGTRWNAEIGKKLETSTIGIFCLTPDNLTAPWINFEAGAVSKAVEDARVFTYLFELEYKQVEYPLAQFNHTKATQAETLRMLHDVNNLLLLNEKVDDNRLERLFANCWPNLEEKLKVVARKMAETKTEPQKRSSDDMLNEILELSRGLAKRVPEYIIGLGQGKLPGDRGEPGFPPRPQQGELPSDTSEPPQGPPPRARSRSRKKK